MLWTLHRTGNSPGPSPFRLSEKTQYQFIVSLFESGIQIYVS